MEANPLIFREYDIRGVVDHDLTDDIVTQIGKAFSAFLYKNQARSVSLGGDVRLSTERFRGVLIDAFRESGIDVIDLGAVPTPLQYYSMHYLEVDAGLMITGSHNPPDYNGFKMSLHNAPVYGNDIQNLLEIIQTGQYVSGSGNYKRVDVANDYISYIKNNIRIEKPVKAVLDSGNGAGALIAHRLFRELGIETVDLFDTPDGTFPNHHPDPTVEENIQDLIAAVKKEKADFGVGYDGDADRIGVVDEQGHIIWGDGLMIIFARDILKRAPGSKIIFEVKCSQALPQMIARFGGEPVMWKTGHSLLKKKMKETGAPLAGEMSGHIFFADRYFGFDDAIYASARFAELVSKSPDAVSQFLADVPPYFSTPEIRAEAESDTEKFRIAKKAMEFFSQNYEVIDIDGVRIQFGDGWGLVRASNTQPVLVLRFEASTAERLEEIRNLVVNKLQEFGSLAI